MLNIFAMRLVNNEDIIAKVETATTSTGFKTKLKLSKPAIIMMMPDQSGKPNMGLADYLMFAEKKELMIDEDHILFMYEPMTQLLNAYNQMFGSGLVVPSSANGILPFKR
jgi:hypothetical protein